MELRSFADAVGGRHRVIGGPFGSKLTQAHYVPAGVPVIRGSNMDAGRRVAGEFVFVTPNKFERDLRTNAARPGDIIVTQRGTLGQVAIVPDDANYSHYVVSQSQMAVSVDRQVADRDFVYYFLTSAAFLDYVETSTIQTGVPHINLGILRDAKVSWPSRPVQETVARILSALDDKIELNRRMNETLEVSARALFRDWFVDFGPTRAKADGRPAYLAPDLWSLFPDRLDDDGVPEGWGTARLTDHATVTKGRSYSSAELSPSATALVTLKSFERGGGYRRDGLKPYTGSFKDEQVVSHGEIVISQTDVTQAAELIGRPARVIGDARFERLVASLDVAILRPEPQSYLDREFLFGLTDSNTFTHHALAHTSGTTVLHLARNAIPSFEFVLPSVELVAAHRKRVAPLIRKVAQNVHESDTLAATRDALLPKLMSGEIRVRDAEALAA